MRSRALQALGPLRPSSPSLRHLRHIHRPASRAPTTPTPRPAIRQAAPITSTTRARAAKPSPPPPSQQFVDPEASTPEGVPAADIDVALSSGSSLAGENPPPASSAFGETISASSSAIPPGPDASGGPAIDWSSSFHGLSTAPFEARVAETLMRSLDPEDVEVKPDGIIYLPEIKYRRILNAAFGPGGWGLAPRGELAVGDKVVTREYALIVHGRFVAQARGECQYFSEETIPTAGEGCKSNALMRCCKDLGIASELWDPRFIRRFKKEFCQEIWVEHVATKKRRQIWIRKDSDPAYPYTLVRKVKI